MKTHNYGPNLALLAAVCSLAACTESTPVASAPSDSAEVSPTSTRAIDPGKYRVCADFEDEHSHSNMIGVHIEVGTEVEIRTIQKETATLVCIGACPADPMDPASSDKVLWMIGDTDNLGTVHAFAHKDKTTNAPIEPMPRHLVQLKGEADVPDTCDSQKKVLMMRFCEWGKDDDGNADWLCAGAAPHAGAVHLQPP